MILPFEKWIKEQDFDTSAVSLFEEAVTCYKSNTYRASLMLSYLAFMTSLKRRIMMSETPNGFTDTEWQAGVQNKLRNDETWDTTLFDFTQQKPPKKPIFDVSEDLREQIKYWKNRRNDCAHAKDNAIEHFHVESFWSCLQSNLPKLVVGGGMANLVNRIRFHFDLSRTPLNADYSGIVADIQHGVSRKDMIAFFTQAEQIIKSLSNGASSAAAADRHLEFFEKVFLRSAGTVAAEELAKFIKSDSDRLDEFLFTYPTYIARLELDKSFVRSYWMTTVGVGYMRFRKVVIVLSMFRLRLIPEDEVPELRQAILEKGHFRVVSDYDGKTLKEMGFWALFHEKYIASGDPITNFNDGNRVSELFIYYLGEFEIKDDIVKVLCSTFDRLYHPHSLLDDLKEFFSRHPEKLNDFKRVMRENNLEEPKYSFFP